MRFWTCFPLACTACRLAWRAVIPSFKICKSNGVNIMLTSLKKIELSKMAEVV